MLASSPAFPILSMKQAQSQDTISARHLRCTCTAPALYLHLASNMYLRAEREQIHEVIHASSLPSFSHAVQELRHRAGVLLLQRSLGALQQLL